jgi:oligoribonuclease
MSVDAKNPARLIWCDIETSGLDPHKDVILEIAWKLTSFEFPWEPRQEDAACVDAVVDVVTSGELRRCSPEVEKMHRASGLWGALERREGTKLELLENDLLILSSDWPGAVPKPDASPEERKQERDARVMIAGSSAHFDLGFLRVHMPRFAKRLSHRVFDVSATRAFCRSLGMPRSESDGKEPAHRAIADLEASIQIGRDCAAWMIAPAVKLDQLHNGMKDWANQGTGIKPEDVYAPPDTISTIHAAYKAGWFSRPPEDEGGD